MGRRPSTFLSDCIASLDASERGYIQKSLQRPLGRRSGLMLELYNAFLVDSNENSTAVQAVLKGAGKGASQLKRSLYDSIVKTLRTLADDRTDRSKAIALLEEATVLTERSMLEAARERVLSALIYTNNAHLFSIEADALSTLIRIEREKRSVSSADLIPDYIHRRTEVLKLALDASIYAEMSSDLMRTVLGGVTTISVTDVLQHPLVIAEHPSSHPRLAFWRHHVRGLAFHLSGQVEEQNNELQQMVEIIRKEPVFLQEDTSITLLSNVLTSQIQEPDVAGARSTLELLQRIDPPTKRMRDDLWFNEARSRMYVLNLEGRYTEVLDLEAEMVKGVKLYPIHGNVVLRTWHQLSAVAALNLGDARTALRHIRSVLDQDLPSERQYIAGRLIEIISLVKENDHHVADHRIRSFERTHSADLERSDLLQHLIRFLRSCARSNRDVLNHQTALLSYIQKGIVDPFERTLRATILLERSVSLLTSPLGVILP